MTVTFGNEVAESAPGPVCGLCGRSMAADQEWCLECGAARTVIARPPDWRIPVLVIGVIVLLLAGGFAYALTQLGSHAGKVTVVTAAAPRTRASTPTLATWMPGEDGYTVVLATARTQATADREATKLLAAHVTGVGVLDSSHYPEMRAQGVWDVFAGRYPSYAQAQAAATTAAHHGQADATPALVQRPGQG